MSDGDNCCLCHHCQQCGSVQVSTSGGNHWGWDLWVMVVMNIVVIICREVIELVSGGRGH